MGLHAARDLHRGESEKPAPPRARAVRRRPHRAHPVVLVVCAGLAALTCSLILAAPSRPEGRAASASGIGAGQTGALRMSSEDLTAAAALQAFDSAFAVRRDKAVFYRLTTTGGSTTLFKESELIEMVIDAYRRTRSSGYLGMLKALYRGLILKEGKDWMHARSNDDLMWSALMCMHLYDVTGDATYLQRAQRTFDQTYARARSTDLGGGLWNTVNRRSKNTCVVAPAVMAAGELYKALDDPHYLRIARTLFAWLRAHLYDTATGAVWDNVSQGSGGIVVDHSTYTYNQGGFLGAAEMLYRITGQRSYHAQALKALAFTKATMSTDGGILKSEAGSDPLPCDSAGGFKGIFVRNAWPVIQRYHLTADKAWLIANAGAARSCADAQGLIDEDWSRRTDATVLSSFSCSSAVVLLQATGP